MTSINHVAIIMDGNGRWAKIKNKSRNYGHYQGTRNIESIIDFCLKKKISFLTLFAFSLDNWKRPKNETTYLFSLIEKFIEEKQSLFLRENIKIKFIGEIDKLEKKIQKIILDIEKKTKKNKNITVNIALNYSSKNEILNSFRRLIQKKNKKISIKDIHDNLYTSKIPDPEILIRTGGYQRLSDFLLWQISYSELFFIKKLWPDFSYKDLNLILKKYHHIKRNFGAL